jgi:hypothetical protein
MIPPNQEGFIKLPNERILYTSPPRTSLSLSPMSTSPGHQPWSVKSDGGKVYITNQRVRSFESTQWHSYYWNFSENLYTQIVYLPTSPTPELQSFSAPILNLQDTYVRAPIFGANCWNALIRPVAGGGIPPHYPAVELRMTFREGGAFDYHTTFERIKEHLRHAIQIARDQGRNIGSVGALSGADLAGVHLEQLPAYEPSQQATGVEPGEDQVPVSPVHPVGRDSSIAGLRSQPRSEEVSTPPVEPPNEPPPGYEEAQVQAVGIDLDQRLREEAERGSP